MGEKDYEMKILDTLMPPISKSYMTTNDYYMKIGVIIETLMPPIFI